MDTRTLTVLCATGILMSMSSGCGQRLNLEKTITVEPGGVRAPFIVDAPKSEQKVTVEVSSAEVPVTVQVVTVKDRAKFEKAMEDNNLGPDTMTVLSKKEKIKEDTVEAPIPAGQEFAVLVFGGSKSATVKVKLTAR